MSISMQTELDLERLRIRRLNARNNALKGALLECLEYFEDNYDADHDGENYVPNKAMRLGAMIREALELDEVVRNQKLP